VLPKLDKARLDTGCVGYLYICLIPAFEFREKMNGPKDVPKDQKPKWEKDANGNYTPTGVADYMKANPPQNLPGVEGAWLTFEDATSLKGVKRDFGPNDKYVIFAWRGDWVGGKRPMGDPITGQVDKNSIDFMDPKNPKYFADWDYAVYQPDEKVWVNANGSVDNARKKSITQQFFSKKMLEPFGTHKATLYFAYIVREKK
jgi:hypothetical protein